MFAVAVGRESVRQLEVRFSRRDRIEYSSSCNTPGHLCNDVGISSLALKRPLTDRPTETAGFRWQPEIWPMAYAIVRTVRPKAKDTPIKPIPTPRKAAARTALPHPPKTSQNVPMNSAVQRFPISMFCFLFLPSEFVRMDDTASC